VHEISIPQLPISEKTRWGELPEAVGELIEVCERTGVEMAAMVILEPVECSRDPSQKPMLSEAPEELVVVALNHAVRMAVFEALERVRDREADLAPGKPRPLPKFSHKTPLKSFFRQMRDMPATVLSVTFPADGPEAITVFFLGSPFTISEFRRELAQILAGEEAGRGQDGP